MNSYILNSILIIFNVLLLSSLQVFSHRESLVVLSDGNCEKLSHANIF